MLAELLDPARHLLFWLSSKPNCLRVRGARIEVVASLVARNPEPSILLAQSRRHAAYPSLDGA